jgi:nucleoside-triphosphatase THEP1
LLLYVVASATEGRDEDMRRLWLPLLSGGGVHGLLLHGMGGVGKTTLATLLANHLQSTGAFPGGVYVVSVHAKTQYAAESDTLLDVQKSLLGAITQQTELKPPSLDVGAEWLEGALRKIKDGSEDALQKTKAGPVLLVIDNVPEGESGIGELLPQNMRECLADG